MAEELEITANELKQLIDSGTHFALIDVREQNAYDLCHIYGSRLIPLSQLRSRVKELDVTNEYVFYCHTGERSGRAVSFLS